MPALPLAKLDQDKPILLPVARELLRDALRAKSKTITVLASELGISRKHLSNVLNGHAPLLEPLLHRLAAAAGVESELLVCLLDHGPGPRPDPYGFMPGWIVAHDDLSAPMEGWEMLDE